MEQELLDAEVSFDLPPHKPRERVQSNSDSGRGSTCSPVLMEAVAPDGDGDPSDSSSDDDEPPPQRPSPSGKQPSKGYKLGGMEPKPYHTDWEESILQRKTSTPEEFIRDVYVAETYDVKLVQYLWSPMMMEKRVWKVYKWSELDPNDTDFGHLARLKGWATYIAYELGLVSQEQMYARLELEVTHVYVACRWATMTVGSKPEHPFHKPGAEIHQCESEEPTEPLDIQEKRLKEEWEEIVKKHPNVIHVPSDKIIHNFSEEMMMGL